MKQVVEGWAYPCELSFRKCTNFGSNSSLTYNTISTNIAYKKYPLSELQCECGKHKQPVRVRVTVEEINEREK